MDLNAVQDSTAQSPSLRSLSDPNPHNPSSPSDPPTQIVKPATTTINSTDTVCPICQETYNQGSQAEIPLTLPCGHAFGSVCIAQWLHVRNRNHGCPICRAMPFGTPPPNDDDLEDGEIVENDDGEEVMSQTSDYDEVAPAFNRNRAFAEYRRNGAAITLAHMGQVLINAMNSFLGRHLSTLTITQMVRTGQGLGLRPQPDFIPRLLRDHGVGNEVFGLSYRQAMARQYALLKAKMEQAAEWLHERATDYVMAELIAHVEVSQRKCAQGFLQEDRETLKLLIKAGILQSRRLEGSFDIRVGLALRIPGTPQDLDDWCKRYVHRVVVALPSLGDAYGGVINAQVNQSSTIPQEIDFRKIWNADMALEPLSIFDSPPPRIRTYYSTTVERSTPQLAQTLGWLGLSPLTNSDVSQTSLPPSDPTPSSLEQQREETREANNPYAWWLERMRLAGNNPFSPSESFVRNGPQRRNGISEEERAGR